ncbi:NUDIX hydrolase [Terracoccus luteus]|uniref:8-oxo-dGTP pyrophosphatase MutT (NUDIX family) n=1 Tax=Terracoccus luteus TaxID=53356 RepID=A0A839PR87_9MICO|nr:NUDIX domain-containing protein [Terracoccus luteus]MBB2985579.1 8-oxo-dGTP pyrophosphatase MutT (NUDIX family) [Terracoccus luteus]MCP2171231.1 8-oxo-dGTP pyrophosphatase MutT (NUDIX family) [Terracoccus luteus]
MSGNVTGGVLVVGVVGDREQVVAPLAHGEHPEAVLARHGLRALRARSARLAEGGALELTYEATPLTGIPPEAPSTRRDPDVGDDEVGEPFQRVAAYALVTTGRHVLLTQFNSRTDVPGDWGLPGGGLDPGESPDEGLHREVWEETGQRIELGPLLTVQSQHWVGRAPDGRLEDFHAVRIVHRATCPSPAPVVVHDVGGTTADARWVAFDELDGYPLSASWRELTELTALADTANGAAAVDLPSDERAGE